MAQTGHELVEIYRAPSLPQAHALRLVLEEAGIRVQIEGEHLQGAVGQLPIGWATAPRLLAPEFQAIEAREIIRSEEERERSSPDAISDELRVASNAEPQWRQRKQNALRAAGRFSPVRRMPAKRSHATTRNGSRRSN